MVPRRHAQRAIHAHEQRRTSDVRCLLPPPPLLVEDMHLEGDPHVLVVATAFLLQVLEHSHQPPVRRCGEVFAAQVVFLKSQPRRDHPAYKLAAAASAIPCLDRAGVCGGVEVAVMVDRVLEAVTGGCQPGLSTVVKAGAPK